MFCGIARDSDVVVVVVLVLLATSDRERVHQLFGSSANLGAHESYSMYNYGCTLSVLKLLQYSSAAS